MGLHSPPSAHAAPASELAGQLAHRYIEGATALHREGQWWASVLVLCCGIDALAALYAGRDSYVGTANDFIAFVERYMPAFAQKVPSHLDYSYQLTGREQRARRGRLVWAMPPHQPVGSCAEVLYRGYRCGLIHQGLMSPGVRVVDKPGKTAFAFEVDHLNGEVAFSMQLNARGLQAEFARASSRYMADLDGSDALAERFWQRWKFITGPQWALVAP